MNPKPWFRSSKFWTNAGVCAGLIVAGGVGLIPATWAAGLVTFSNIAYQISRALGDDQKV